MPLPHTTEWDEMDQIIFSPHIVKLGMLAILQQSCSHNKSMHNLELFVNTLIYEKKKLILSETGLFLSTSMFVTFDMLPKPALRTVLALIDSNVTRSVFKKNGTVNICFDSPVRSDNNALGVVNVVCGLLLAINEARSVQQQHTTTHDNMLCIFDVILKSVFFKHRIDYSLVLQNCVQFGYCGVCDIEQEESAETVPSMSQA